MHTVLRLTAGNMNCCKFIAKL